MGETLPLFSAPEIKRYIPAVELDYFEELTTDLFTEEQIQEDRRKLPEDNEVARTTAAESPWSVING